MANDILSEQFKNQLRKSLEAKDWKPIDPLKRAVTTASGLALGAAIPFSASKIFSKALPPKLTPALMILMGGLGYAAPTLANNLIKKYENDPQEAEEYMNYIAEKGNTIPTEVLQKISSWAGLKAMGTLTGKVIGFGARAAKDLGRGLFMPLKFPAGTPISERALSYTSKGLAGYGAYKGGQYAIKKSRKPDYTTFLRNQIVSGKIQPGQLNRYELSKVMELGT